MIRNIEIYVIKVIIRNKSSFIDALFIWLKQLVHHSFASKKKMNHQCPSIISLHQYVTVSECTNSGVLIFFL